MTKRESDRGGMANDAQPPMPLTRIPSTPAQPSSIPPYPSNPFNEERGHHTLPITPVPPKTNPSGGSKK